MEKQTMIHPETGELLTRDIRPVEFCYKGEKIILDMPGWYPPEGDNGVFTMKDMAVHDKALRILKARVAAKSHENFSAENFALA